MKNKAHSGVDPRGHGPDGKRGAGYACDPYKSYGGVDDRSATHGSGKAGKAKPGGRASRSKNLSY